MGLGLWGVVVCCLLASSIEPILVKIGFLGGVSPFLLIVLRMLFAGICVALIGGRSFFLSISYQTYKKVLPLALLLLLTNSLMITALIYSNPSLVITIITLTPALVGVVSYALGYEGIDYKFWMGVACCFLGVFITINGQLGFESVANIRGIILSSLAVLSSTLYRVLLGRRTKEIPPKTITSYIFINNGFIALLFLPFLYQEITWKVGSISIWTGLAAVCANAAFVYAVKQVGAARMSLIDLLQRPLVVILSMLMLGEALTANQVCGIILVSIGVYLANIGKRTKTKEIKWNVANG